VAASALKESPDDRKRLKHYFRNALKARTTPFWQQFTEAGSDL
jgi:hypothetical protein